MINDKHKIDGIPVIQLQNELLSVDVAPLVGGKIVNIYNKQLDYQFLWHNPGLKLRKNLQGDEYDPNFYGGIDDMLPNDVPENFNGINFSDHGEVWTTQFDYNVNNDTVKLYADLALTGFRFEKTLKLQPNKPCIDINYQIKNNSKSSKIFTWRIHAALEIKPGDKIVCPAQTAIPADANWSSCEPGKEYPWPNTHDKNLDTIPEKNGSCEFLFLKNLTKGAVGLERKADKLKFEISFDRQIFPYVCYFATFGKLNNCYTAVIEPCNLDSVSVSNAAKAGTATALKPNQQIETNVSIFAGVNNYLCSLTI